MELNITEFWNTADPFNYSASVAELGDNAGKITWNNARNADYQLLKTEDEREAFLDDLEIIGFLYNYP